MPTNSLLVQINATACLAIGWPVNLLLIWLILYRTNQELRVWSRVLLQSAILDMGLALIAFLNQIEIVSRNGGIYFKFNGPLEYSSQPIKQFQLYLFSFWLEFSRHATAVQFAYRWLVICREKQVSNKCYLLMLLIPFTFVSVEILSLLFDRIQNCHDGCEVDGELVYFVSYGTSTMWIGAAIFIASMTITTISIITFTVLCWWRTRKGLMMQNARSQKIARQVSTVLFLQAVYPIGFAMIPGMMATIFVVLDVNLPGWLSLFATNVWNTVVYPMCAILVIGHYRRSLMKMFGLNGRNIVASSGTQNQQQPNAGNQVGSSGQRMMIAS